MHGERGRVDGEGPLQEGPQRRQALGQAEREQGEPVRRVGRQGEEQRAQQWAVHADAPPHSFSASAPPMISISSLVMAAWRARLYCSVSVEIISLAFLVAESIAVMRAPNSLACDS